MKTETGKEVLLLGDFVNFGESTGMIVGLEKNTPNLEDRVFKVLVVGSTSFLDGIVPVPYKKLTKSENQDACKNNYSLIFLGYATWSD